MKVAPASANRSFSAAAVVASARNEWVLLGFAWRWREAGGRARLGGHTPIVGVAAARGTAPRRPLHATPPAGAPDGKLRGLIVSRPCHTPNRRIGFVGGARLAYRSPRGRGRPPVCRRRLVVQLSALLALPRLGWAGTLGAQAYPATVAAMKAARDVEFSVHHHYVEYGRQARREGYLGVAYLFAAVAASERVHAANFSRLLARLDADAPPAPPPVVTAGSTRENLLRGAKGEIHSVDTFYPGLLEQLEPEGFEDAILAVRWAWESEKQHRDKMQQILRWSPMFFEKVARTIDEKTGRYLVCQICGATVNTLPPTTCSVCKQPATAYRLIAPPSA